MPLPNDLFDIVETITISNLANLTLPTPTLVVPAGLEFLYTTLVTNHYNNLGLPPDIQEVVTAVITNTPDLVVTVS